MKTQELAPVTGSWGVEVPHKAGQGLRQSLRRLLFASSLALSLVSSPSMASTTTLETIYVTGYYYDAWGDVGDWWPSDFFPADEQSLGWDPGYYGGDPPDQQCDNWLQDNPTPPGCDPNNAPPPVSANGCGPDSFLGSLVPNLWFGTACNTHDVCYSQLDSDKNRCDDAFHQNMNQTCDSLREIERECEYDPIRRRSVCQNIVTETTESLACRDAAGVYWDAVQSSYGWAAGRFNALQTEAVCRNWHAKKELESDCP